MNCLTVSVETDGLKPSRVGRRSSRSLRGGAVLLAFAGLPTLPAIEASASSTLVLQPGEFKEHVILDRSEVLRRETVGTGLLNEGVRFSPTARASIEFVLPENKMRLYASAAYCSPDDRHCFDPGPYRARAQARISKNFMVALPESGQSTPVAATVSFDVARVGFLTTIGPSATVDFAVNVDIIDLSAGNKSVAFQEITKVSQGSLLGEFVTIKSVPIPIPEITDAELTNRRVFAVNLIRGHVYRVRMAAIVTAESGLGVAEGNLKEPIPVFQDLEGFIELHNLSIDVAPDLAQGIEQLRMDLESLRSDHQRLSMAHAALRADHDALRVGHDALRAEHDELTEAHQALRSAHDELRSRHDLLEQEFRELVGNLPPGLLRSRPGKRP